MEGLRLMSTGQNHGIVRTIEDKDLWEGCYKRGKKHGLCRYFISSAANDSEGYEVVVCLYKDGTNVAQLKFDG